jgi:outer membrane protein
MKGWPWIILLILAVTPALRGESDKLLTLHECINEALGRSPRLESERYNLAADQEAIKRARAGLLPSVSITGDLQNLTGSPVGPFAILGENNVDETGISNPNRGTRFAAQGVNLATVGTGGVLLNYPLYEHGSILGLNNAPAVASAKSVFQRQQWTIRLSEQTVIETLAGVYYNATAYEQKTGLDQRKVELSKKRVVILQQELALDLTLAQNVELAKSELAADEQLLQTSQQRTTDSKMQLAQLIGRRLHEKLKLDLSEPHIPAVPPLQNFLNQVALHHPAIKAQEANIDVAQQNLRIAESALLPTVGFSGSYTAGTAFSTENPTLFTFGLHASVPIFDWGHNLDAEREERDRVKAAQAELGQVDLELRESLLTQLSDIHTTESAIATLERDYVAATNNYNLTNEQHEQGTATELALVDAEATVVKVKDDLVLAKLVQRLQYVQLQKIAGGVWAWNR